MFSELSLLREDTVWRTHNLVHCGSVKVCFVSFSASDLWKAWHGSAVTRLRNRGVNYVGLFGVIHCGSVKICFVSFSASDLGRALCSARQGGAVIRLGNRGLIQVGLFWVIHCCSVKVCFVSFSASDLWTALCSARQYTLHVWEIENWFKLGYSG